jgi:hypothetical protein
MRQPALPLGVDAAISTPGCWRAAHPAAADPTHLARPTPAGTATGGAPQPAGAGAAAGGGAQGTAQGGRWVGAGDGAVSGWGGGGLQALGMRWLRGFRHACHLLLFLQARGAAAAAGDCLEKRELVDCLAERGNSTDAACSICCEDYQPGGAGFRGQPASSLMPAALLIHDIMLLAVKLPADAAPRHLRRCCCRNWIQPCRRCAACAALPPPLPLGMCGPLAAQQSRLQPATRLPHVQHPARGRRQQQQPWGWCGGGGNNVYCGSGGSSSKCSSGGSWRWCHELSIWLCCTIASLHLISSPFIGPALLHLYHCMLTNCNVFINTHSIAC